MMTPEDFRRLALSLPEAKEVHIRGRSQFRVKDKFFASLSGLADSIGLLNLTPEQQIMFMHAAPRTFHAVPRGSKRLASTTVLLASAKAAVVESALMAAWRNVAPASLLQRIDVTAGNLDSPRSPQE